MHWRAGTLNQDGQQEKGEQKYLFVPLIFQTISTCKGPLTSVLRLCTPPLSSLSPEGFRCHHPDWKGIESRSHSFRDPHLAAALCHVGSVKVAGTSCSIWSLKPEWSSKHGLSGPMTSQSLVMSEQHSHPKMPPLIDNLQFFPLELLHWVKKWSLDVPDYIIHLSYLPRAEMPSIAFIMN